MKEPNGEWIQPTFTKFLLLRSLIVMEVLIKTQYYISSKQFCSTWLYVVAILVVTQSWEQHEMEKFHPRPTHYGGNLRQVNA